ncbi:MAG TPA: trypsin-like serine protease [Candidatus Acidoferrales bacterium]|nr:trypsin-like serine protease [Candidatus Acidoferrales bacterium]
MPKTQVVPPKLQGRVEAFATRHAFRRSENPSGFCLHSWRRFVAGLFVVCSPFLLGLAALAASIEPQIVNGTPTVDYPSVAAFLFYDDVAHTQPAGLCSATLIGCHTVLTAAHCVCDFDDAATCASQGLIDPATLQVYLPYAGFFDVVSTAIDPAYQFAVGGDAAIMTLAKDVTGIQASTLNTVGRPVIGTRASIVGFGLTDNQRSVPDDSGINRVGMVTTTSCTDGIPDDAHLCWQFTGVDSNTCEGDSGGPMFVDFGSGPLLAGITSGGETNSCLPVDNDYDTDVFVHRAWIEQQAGTDLGMSCGNLAAVGSSAVQVTAFNDSITSAVPGITESFNVPAGTQVLRVTLNGQAGSGVRPDRVSNDFDLYVRKGAAPTVAQFDCKSSTPTTFEACELPNPTAGTWFARVVAVQGIGTLQLTATSFPIATKPTCVGDCHGDGEVTIDDLILGVSIALEDTPLTACPVFDADGSGSVSVDELITGVNNALAMCPSA